jgi:hypothetical protein
MSSSSNSSIGRLSPEPHITSSHASSARTGPPPPPLPSGSPRPRAGGPLNRLQSFSANQSTRTQTEAAVAHATPVEAATVANVGAASHAQHATGAAQVPEPSHVAAFRARARDIDFSAPPLEQRIAELGHLVEEFTTLLHNQGTLHIVSHDELVEHFARDMEAGGQVPAGQDSLAAARDYINRTNSLGFTSQNLPGGPIYATDGPDGSHFARHEVLHLLSAPKGQTKIQKENNGTNLNEALTEAATRLIERGQGMGALNAHQHAYPAMAELMLGLADANEGIKRGMLEAFVQDGGKEKLVDAMVAHWGARTNDNQIANARLRKPANDAQAHRQMAGVLSGMVGDLGGQPSLQQINDGYVGMTKPKLDAYLGTHFAQ